mmetsp:Transcript_20618/g.60251  ORF Transcript_20618/g.60251 Transcript_20618/m.60251 type:complete len:232 (-) Transcript_20618:900-1595(-)
MAETLRRVLGENGLDEELGGEGHGRGHGEGEDCGFNVLHGFTGKDLVVHVATLEGRRAVHHLVDHNAEGPEVGAVVVGLLPALLGAQVRVGAQHRRALFPRWKVPRKSIVAQLEHAVLIQQEVGGLDVPVDDATLVHVLESQDKVRGVAPNVRMVQRKPAFVDLPVKVTSFCVVHEHEEPGLRSVGVHQARVERAVQGAHDLYFAEGHALVLGRLELVLVKDLERVERRRG